MRVRLGDLRVTLVEAMGQPSNEELKRFEAMGREQLTGLVNDVKDVLMDLAPEGEYAEDRDYDMTPFPVRPGLHGIDVALDHRLVYRTAPEDDRGKKVAVAINKLLAGKFKSDKSSLGVRYLIEANENVVRFVWSNYAGVAVYEFTISIMTSNIPITQRDKWEMERSAYRAPTSKLMGQFYFAWNKAGHRRAKPDVYDLAWWLGSPNKEPKMPDADRKKIYDATGWETVKNEEELNDISKALLPEYEWLWHELRSAALALWNKA